MSPINTTLTALICIYAAFENTHLTCAYCTPLCVCVEQLSVLWSDSALEPCADNLHVTEVLAAVFWATHAYLGHNGTAKRKTNQVNMGGLSVPDWRSVSQQWDFLSNCLLVYSYRLMSPLPSPPRLSWAENNSVAAEISDDTVKHLWSRECFFLFFHPFMCVECLFVDLWNTFVRVCVKVKFIKHPKYLNM